MYGGTFKKIKSHFCHFLPMLSPSPLHPTYHYTTPPFYIITSTPTHTYIFCYTTPLFYAQHFIHPRSLPINTPLNPTYKHTQHYIIIYIIYIHNHPPQKKQKKRKIAVLACRQANKIAGK